MNIYQEKRRALGHHCPGIGGSSKSSTASNDNRVTAGEIGISGSGNVVQVTDGGLISRGLASLDLGLGRSLDTVDLSIANLGEGYQSLIDTANDIFTQGQSLIGQTQKSVADAYGQAEADKSGAIDQRTIIVLAVAVAVVAGIYFVNRRKG